MTDMFDTYDEEGNRYVILVRRSSINNGNLSGPSRIEGLTSFHLSGGGALNRIDDQTFEIVATGKRLIVRI